MVDVISAHDTRVHANWRGIVILPDPAHSDEVRPSQTSRLLYFLSFHSFLFCNNSISLNNYPFLFLYYLPPFFVILPHRVFWQLAACINRFIAESVDVFHNNSSVRANPHSLFQ